jgi:hypothetical protein
MLAFKIKKNRTVFLVIFLQALKIKKNSIFFSLAFLFICGCSGFRSVEIRRQCNNSIFPVSIDSGSIFVDKVLGPSEILCYRLEVHEINSITSHLISGDVNVFILSNVSSKLISIDDKTSISLNPGQIYNLVIKNNDHENTIQPCLVFASNTNHSSASLLFPKESLCPSSLAEFERFSYKIDSKQISTMQDQSGDQVSPVNLVIKYETTPFSPQPNSQDLEEIKDSVISLIKSRKLPLESISISIVDFSEENCCEYTGFQDSIKRYPASVVKLFWIVALHQFYESNISIPGNPVSLDDEWSMIHKSDNYAASKILDSLTGTQSGASLNDSDLSSWIDKRLSINRFFQEAGYQNINIVQKTFPIPEQNLDEPVGRDLQLKNYLKNTYGEDNSRNYLTTFETARLLFEIDRGWKISNDRRYDLKQYLFHDHNSSSFENGYLNPIVGYFGAKLPPDVSIYTKVGFTQDDGRQEAAIIESKDGKFKYGLVIFANDPIFSQEGETIFSDISYLVYHHMSRAKE